MEEDKKYLFKGETWIGRVERFIENRKGIVKNCIFLLVLYCFIKNLGYMADIIGGFGGFNWNFRLFFPWLM